MQFQNRGNAAALRFLLLSAHDANYKVSKELWGFDNMNFHFSIPFNLFAFSN